MFYEWRNEEKDLELHAGYNEGNINLIDYNKLIDQTDFLVAGPECPPWASSGNRKGTNDPLAE